MDKGIRPYANALFLRSLPARVNTREGNTAFRKSIIAECMDQFAITLASAATHYNHAFIDARKAAATDEALAALLVGLGRPEDKKGGRKPKAKPEAAVTGTDVAVADEAAADAAPADEAAPEAVLLSEGIKENTSTHTVTVNPEVKYSVRKVSDGTVVCGDLTLDEANALIAKAAAAKKAKLELVA